MNTQQLLLTIAETSVGALLACDLSGAITYANPALVALCGWTTPQLCAMNCRTLLAHFPVLTAAETPDDLPPRLLSLQGFDSRLNTPWGGTLPVAVEVVPVHEGDAITGLLLTFVDQRSGESLLKALRQSEATHRALVEHMLNGLVEYQVVLDERGVPVDAIFLAANAAFETITGIRREAIIGRRVTQVRPETDGEWLALIAKVALTGEAVRFERHSAQMGKWFAMLAYCPREGHCVIVSEDITEQRQVSAALAQSETRYRELVEHASSLILMLDPEGRLAFANNSAVEFFGRPEKALLGCDLVTLLGTHEGAGGQDLRAFLAGGVKLGDLCHCETMLPTADGTARWADWTVEAIEDGGDSPFCLLCIGAEVTQRKQTERALRESEERYRLLFERSPVGVFHYSPQLRITDCNERFVQILQSSRERLIGLDLHTLNDLRVLPCLQDGVSGKEGLFEGSYAATTGTGTPWLVLRTAPLYGPDGKITGGVGITEDLSARKEAEEVARRRQQEITTLLDSLPGYAFFKSADGRYVTANEQFCRAVGRQRDEIVGCSDGDLFPPELAHRNQADDRLVLQSGRPVEVEEEILDEERLLVVATRKVPLLDESGQANGLIGLGFDITDRKRSEDSQRLASVGQLAAGVAHEFNNLLAAMMMKAELAIYRDEPEQYEELARMVLRSSVRGAAICRNLAACAGPRALARTSVSVTTPLEAALSASEPQLVDVGIEVRRLYQDHGVPLLADPRQLEQLFLNIIINACHAMPEGGILTVCTGHRETPLGPVVTVTVSDTGAGIKPEHLPRVFEPFFTTKGLLGRSNTPGTGLGLSISHGIVKAHGGRIEMRSEPGEGVVVVVELPELVEPGVETEAELGRQVGIAAAWERSLRVLVADDETEVRELVTHILADNGCVVTAAATTAEALAALEADEFDLVIADWLMPGGGGREVAASAKARNNPPPVVVITGRVEAAINDELLAAEVVRRLQKPFHVAELMAVVNQIRFEMDDR